ncbi:WEB family protein At2g38370-like [Curcuma longa]|uniref:WEB family protein At2g38370-like n=1 Tax=Curcuma longa TaxID=136217 RepID=UPI003D9E9D7E
MMMKVRPSPPPPPLRSVASAAGVMEEEAKKRSGRGEVDSSVPFRSVKEAVERFGGGSSAAWRPHSCSSLLLSPEDVELMKIEEQTVKLEMDLFLKERETLSVLKELEMAKKKADGLKLRLHMEANKAIEEPERCSDKMMMPSSLNQQQKCFIYYGNHREFKDQSFDHRQTKQSPCSTLRELNQAKLYLKTTSGLVGCENSVEHLRSAIEMEKNLLKETCERLSSKTVQVSCLEKEISRTLDQTNLIKGTKRRDHRSSSDVLTCMKEQRSDTEKFKRIAAAAKTEMSKLSLDIQQAKSGIKAAELRFAAAKKVEAAARNAEATTLSKVKSLTDGVTITVEEYNRLIKRAQGADETLRKRMEAAMNNLKGAQESKLELLEKVEEANADVETSRKALHEALKKGEDANRGRLAVEEALRKWKSHHDRTRPSHLTNTKFKNSAAPRQRRSWILDVNGMSLISAGPSQRADTPSLSIGQILSRKLTGYEEHESQALQIVNGRPRVSLRQMLSRKDDFLSPRMVTDGAQKPCLTKRKKFSVLLLSLFLAKQKKQHQKQSMGSLASFRGKNILR